jgi:hypothetical protein
VSRLFLLPLAIIIAATAGCLGLEARSFCDKRAECADERGDRLAPDSVDVCVVNFETQMNALYANDEPECHDLADTLRRLRSCQVGLRCRDFDSSDNDGECRDERLDVEDARDRIRGDECTAREN